MKTILHRILLFTAAAALTALLTASFVQNGKYRKIENAYYSAAYSTAFEQAEKAAEYIKTILDNKDSISDKDLLCNLADIQSSLTASSSAFKLTAPHFGAEGLQNDAYYMQDLMQLYAIEISRLQSELLIIYQRGSFDEVRNETLEVLSLMSFDLNQICRINNRQLYSFNYDEVRYTWIQLTNSLKSKQIVELCKLKYPDLFDEKHFFIYSKKGLYQR